MYLALAAVSSLSIAISQFVFHSLYGGVIFAVILCSIVYALTDES